jgi:Protein of unknown function (DUF1549)/Protein of unknown function (DUF1553)
MLPPNSRAAKRFAGSAVVVCLIGPAMLGFVLAGTANSLRADNEPSGFKEGDWPFQPLKRPTVPEVKKTDWVRNPIDAFVLAKLEKKGLRPSPPAEKLVLLRRVTYDLTGLPPTPGEQEEFLADDAPDAYEKVVDRLLQSPRYGERWAEHWFDVVRYAETDGFKNDALRPDAYKYRDYVIAALNDDLPYDEFIRQQIAGDELEPGNPQALIATGLNRLYPDEINASNLRQRRQEMLDDVTDVTASAFLGITLGCARCHDHKFDPITQVDYYRFQAIFAGIAPRDDIVAATPRQQAQYHQWLAAWEQATREIRSEIEALVGPARDALAREASEGFDSETRQALAIPPEHRTALQKLLIIQANKWIEFRLRKLANRLTDSQRQRYAELQSKLSEFDTRKPLPLPTALATVDVGRHAPPTYRLAIGDYRKPQEEVRPGFPAFLGSSEPVVPSGVLSDSTGNRAALADWLCRPDHPLTARVMVNRIWAHHFGLGIVGTPNDFGTMGDSPTHPELLDWLAAEFVSRAYSLKAMHRLIVTSATYCQTSLYDPDNSEQAKAHAADPGDHFLWRARGIRLEGEAIRDAVLLVAGDLNLKMGGPSAKPKLPDEIGRYGWDPDPIERDRNRRSVYVLAKRNLRYPLLDVFDLPDMHNSCPRRDSTVTAPQALELLNSDFTECEARQWAGRLIARYRKDKAALVRAAYAEAYARQPTDDELTAARDFISAEASNARHFTAPAKSIAKKPSSVASEITSSDKTISAEFAGTKSFADLPPETEAVVDFCHALFNSNEFLYVD